MSQQPFYFVRKHRTPPIEDNVQANLDFSVSLLEYSGYTALTAKDEKIAVRLAQRAHPVLILSDVCMLALGAARFLFRPIEPQQLPKEVEDCLADREKP